ncbi:hypothetical protein [Clostridium sp. B9]|uniref:hypothetical protein n=1 Tax=Clostridium sp. B9 TaxID=3423224 RepID=UPI003D2EAAE0
MRKASYKFGDKEEIILANCISKSQYDKKYKGNITCPMKGCNAKLGFREVKKHKDGKYFYTLPKNKHIEGCINKVEKKSKRRNRHLKINTQSLYEKEIDINSEQLIFDI